MLIETEFGRYKCLDIPTKNVNYSVGKLF